MGTFTCEPWLNSSLLKVEVAPGSNLPNATPTIMQPNTQTVRYRSKNARRFGSASGCAILAVTALLISPSSTAAFRLAFRLARLEIAAARVGGNLRLAQSGPGQM